MIKKWILVLFLVSLVISCENQSKELEYRTSEYVVNYTSNLILDNKGAEGEEFVLHTLKSSEDDNFVENINLIIQDYPGSLNDFMNYTNSEISKIANVSQSEIVEVGGRNLHRMIFNMEDNNGELSFLQYGIIKNDKLYLLTFSGASNEFESYISEMEDIMKSFRVF